MSINKMNEKIYAQALPVEQPTPVERDREKAEKYSHFLRTTAEQMLKLSDQLKVGGRELTTSERELLRFAAMPLLRDSMKEMLILFVAGENPANGPAFKDILDVFEDLTK